jgi:hypothetical protein
MIFKFPKIHDECSTCENRFVCLTSEKIDENLSDPSNGGYTTWEFTMPFRFGLGCFVLEPHKRIGYLSLQLVPDGMKISFSW